MSSDDFANCSNCWKLDNALMGVKPCRSSKIGANSPICDKFEPHTYATKDVLSEFKIDVEHRAILDHYVNRSEALEVEYAPRGKVVTILGPAAHQDRLRRRLLVKLRGYKSAMMQAREMWIESLGVKSVPETQARVKLEIV